MSTKSRKNKNQSPKQKPSLTLSKANDKTIEDKLESTDGEISAATPEQLRAKQNTKSATDMTIKELRALIKEKQDGSVKTDAAKRGKAKLARFRTYAIRQRAWADSQTAKATASEKKAVIAETKLTEYEKKIGVEALTQEEIDNTLTELMSSGRIAQVSSFKVLEPNEEDEAAESTKTK
ncbi:hypothetical protein LCGC14_1774680 [marine sediment metagenome]|uniref:Uncharacterized protein n=1 Tax=marine sediment metagenome TaxID=412755 RepID=A0A0F9JC57_9ZZZZ|nr:hypothetical protein [Methylophaga sp.]